MTTTPTTPTNPTAAPPSGPNRRRARFALRSAVLLLAITASCLFVALLASRANVRIDVTATREHRLSPRTTALLSRLETPHEIVIAGNLSGLDSLSARRSADVLDALAHASPNVRVTTIDTASAKGLDEYDALLDRQVEASGAAIEAMTGQIVAASTAATSLADALDALSDALQGAKPLADAAAAADPVLQQVPGFLNDRATMARIMAQDLRTTVENTGAILARTVGRAPLPPADEASRLLRPMLNAAANDAAALHARLRVVAEAQQVPADLRDASSALVAGAADIRDRAARAVAALDTVRYPPILAAARSLERSGGALVIGEPRPDVEQSPKQRTPGLTAINFDALFPPRMAGADAADAIPDQRFRAEELLATALASLNNPDAPIVVLVHGAPILLAPNYEILTLLRDRLFLRGIDLVEWAAAVNPEPPSLAKIDPTGRRPVVYASISTDASSAEGAARMSRLAATLGRLVADGKPLLLGAVPSSLPSIGESDPMVAFLAPLGIQIDTARPVLRQYRTPTGRIVVPELFITDAARAASEESDHPIASTIRGLPTHLTWPIPIRITADPAATIAPLLAIAADADTWAESDWLDFSRTPADQRTRLTNPPAPGSARDDAKGPWTLAAAVERRLPNQPQPHRMVVVGSNGWFFDELTAKVAGVVDGRTVHQAPGNLELFEAAVYWLAGQDELIAQSPAARAVPLIPPLPGDRLAMIRWLLVLGLPALILLTGVAYRILRG